MIQFSNAPYKQVKTSVSLNTIGELDEIIDKMNRRTSIQEEFRSPKLIKTKSENQKGAVNIFQVPNQVLVNKAQKNPFLMKKIQLALKSQLKRQSELDPQIQQKDCLKQKKQTSFREYTRIRERNEQKKLNQLNQHLKSKV